MAQRTNTSGKQPVSPVMIGVAVVVLVLFLGWIGYRNFGPPPHPVLPDNVNTPIANWIRTKAHESGGDISKLSPEDQQHLQSLTQGKGAAYLKKYAH